MIRNFVGKGKVKLTTEEFDETPTMIAYELPNTDQYDPVFQFKFMDMYGNWSLVDIIHVKNEGDIERGAVFISRRIKIDT